MNTFRLFIVAVVLLFASGSHAVQAFEVPDCVKNSPNDVEEAKVFVECIGLFQDYLAKLKVVTNTYISNQDVGGGAKPIEAKKTYSNWGVDIDKSAFEDTTDVTLLSSSNEIVQGRFSLGGGDNIGLVIRCSENTTALYFHFPNQHMADIQGYGRVDYRIDKKKASRLNMSDSTDSKALGLWRGGKSIPFIKKLFGAKNLLIRYTPYSESPNEVNFNINGLEDVIEPLRKACNW